MLISKWGTCINVCYDLNLASRPVQWCEERVCLCSYLFSLLMLINKYNAVLSLTCYWDGLMSISLSPRCFQYRVSMFCLSHRQNILSRIVLETAARNAPCLMVHTVVMGRAVTPPAWWVQTCLSQQLRKTHMESNCCGFAKYSTRKSGRFYKISFICCRNIGHEIWHVLQILKAVLLHIVHRLVAARITA